MFYYCGIILNMIDYILLQTSRIFSADQHTVDQLGPGIVGFFDTVKRRLELIENNKISDVEMGVKEEVEKHFPNFEAMFQFHTSSIEDKKSAIVVAGNV